MGHYGGSLKSPSCARKFSDGNEGFIGNWIEKHSFYILEKKFVYSFSCPESCWWLILKVMN
jgi:hypothetical protein